MLVFQRGIKLFIFDDATKNVIEIYSGNDGSPIKFYHLLDSDRSAENPVVNHCIVMFVGKTIHFKMGKKNEILNGSWRYYDAYDTMIGLKFKAYTTMYLIVLYQNLTFEVVHAKNIYRKRIECSQEIEQVLRRNKATFVRTGLDVSVCCISFQVISRTKNYLFTACLINIDDHHLPENHKCVIIACEKLEYDKDPTIYKDRYLSLSKGGRLKNEVGGRNNIKRYNNDGMFECCLSKERKFRIYSRGALSQSWLNVDDVHANLSSMVYLLGSNSISSYDGFPPIKSVVIPESKEDIIFPNDC